MLTVEQAFDKIMDGVTPLSTEKRAIEDCHLRTLAAPLKARRSQPAGALSAMDGYAVRSQDLTGDTVSMPLLGDIAAGSRTAVKLSKRGAVRIFTGALLPEGADQVVPQEQASQEGAAVALRADPQPGQHIRPAETDFRERQIVLDAGTVLTPKSIGIAAGSGHGHVMVYRAAKIAIIATGDEVIAAADGPGSAHHIIDSAGPMIHSMLKASGAEIIASRIVKDDPKAIKSAIEDAQEADIVLTIGGASVGDHDHMGSVFKALGASLDFWKIAMRPGKPLMAGHRLVARGHTQRIIGLPGNAVSAFVCALLFVRPLLDRLMGRPSVFPQMADIPVSADLDENGPRAHFMRARLVENDSGIMVDPAHDQDSASLSVLAACDGLLYRPIAAGPAKKGDRLPFLPF